MPANKPESSEWVSLRAAADMLGVHPATVRNWADRGELPSRRTPGGHRRFRRSDLLQHSQTQEDIQPLELRVIIQSALGQARLQIGEDDLGQMAWYTGMSEGTRTEMRHKGREALDAIRRYLSSGAPDQELTEAIRLGQHYAKTLASDGLTLPQAMRGFFYFSDFVVNSILTWSELAQPRDSSEWAGLLRQVNTFIHTMLLSITEYYEEE